MKVYNRGSQKMVDLTCVINGNDISRVVIDNYRQINFNIKLYETYVNNGKPYLSMTDKQVNYWIDIFKCAEEMTFVKNEAYKNIDTDIDIHLDENMMAEILSNGNFNYIGLDDLASQLYHTYRICYNFYFKKNKTKENILSNNDELISRLDTLYSYVMGVKDAYSSDSQFDEVKYCLNNIVKDIGETLTDLKNKKEN